MSEEDSKAVAARQHERAKKTQAMLDEQRQREQDVHVDSMKTTDAHVGKASGEPHKDQAQEDLKVDKARITGDPHVVSAPLKTEGKTTDEVTTSPEGARPGGGGSGPPQSMVDRATRAAAGDETGGAKTDANPDKRKKRRQGRK